MRRKQCEEAFELLITEGVISVKEYGKAKVFLINQNRFPDVDLELLN